MIDDQGYDGNHKNGIMNLTEKWIGIRPKFLKWALQAQWIDSIIDEKNNFREIIHFNSSFLAFNKIE